ncbi:MAG: bifunctional oligoribonuclease/PAP phosphatase NrnA [Oscillospiraceae bacterium]|nr:bifunctional oligoribonuclease/PAP phosphatase NrnA [Oscillospiraceae bacterium]
MNGKSQSISIADAAGFLKTNDNFYILTHMSPDGDAMGSGFGLCFALRAMGKKANVLCSDPFPKRYGFLYGDYAPMKFTPQTIVTVDLADTTLFGRELQVYGEYVDLAIDHHISNSGYASRLLLDGNATAACEVLYQVLKEGNMPIDKNIAACLYTGIATDSGCFKFENTTQKAHMIAAELMGYGIPFAKMNRQLFDIKSKARFMVEQYVINNLETYLDDKCAIIAVTAETVEETGLAPEEFEGLASIPMQIEGVEVGVTIKEKEPNKFKVSMRSAENINVSDICAKLGGGGHIRAAGCTVEGDLSQVKLKLLSVIAPAMGFDLWLS